MLSAEFQWIVAEVVRKGGYAEAKTLGSLSPTHATILSSFVCQSEVELYPNFPAKALILLKLKVFSRADFYAAPTCFWQPLTLQLYAFSQP